MTQDVDQCMADIAALRETVQQQASQIASLQQQLRAMRKWPWSTTLPKVHALEPSAVLVRRLP